MNLKRIIIYVICFVINAYSLAFAEEPVIAKVGDKSITLSEAKRVLGIYARGQDLEKLDSRFIDQMIRNFVQAKALAEVAKDKGIDKDPTVALDMEILFNNILSQALLKKEVYDKISISEQEMETYFKVHRDEFRNPEMVRSRHILIRVREDATQEVKEKARQRATEILKRIKNGEDFAKVASEVSEDFSSKEKGGDIGFVRRGQTVKPYEDKIFSMKVGEISDIVESKFGLHIIKVEEKKEATLQTFEEAKEAVRQKLYSLHAGAKSKDLIDSALEKKKVEINIDALLEALKKK